MINKQYRKKTLKGSFLTKQQGEGLIPRIIIRRRKRHLFLEQRQSLITKDGLHHKKLLEFTEEQNIYTTHRQPNKTNLLLDNPLFDLFYANIKVRANSSVPKPPSDP
jgi:hypothetical protein